MEIDFFENGLCGHCHMVRNSLFEFGQFHSETEENWKSKDREVQDHISKVIESNPNGDKDEIVERYSWELHQNQSQFPNIHRESLIITIYNFLEAQLNELCTIISSCIASQIKLKHLNGLGIERALLYLSKVVEFDLSKMGGELSYIKGVNQLRNQIVHNGGYLPENPNHKVNIFVDKTEALSGLPGSPVNLSSEFVGEFITTLAQFFERLDDEVQAFISLTNQVTGMTQD